MYLNASFDRRRPCYRLSGCDALTSKLIRGIVAPSPNYGALECPRFNKNGLLKANNINTLSTYSVQIAALRAVQCKAFAYEFYEGCQPSLLGFGSGCPAKSCPYLDSRLGDIRQN